MLDWVESLELRMECQAGLNKGEARLARAVPELRRMRPVPVGEHQEPCGKCAEAGIFAFFLNGQWPVRAHSHAWLN